MASGRSADEARTAPDGALEAVIGLEVHVQLATATKMFCRCPNRYGAPPNTLTCPICLGYPGALPTPNHRAVDLAVRLAAALGATVHERSRFARKSYFYPDLPKGYQITQYDHPLATGGSIPLGRRAIGLVRLHLEEDAGRLVHRTASEAAGDAGGSTLVDFNRCGVPLVEIVTRPELRTPGEARDLLGTLHRLLRYLEVSDASMEEGSLRCDANLSVRTPGDEALGTKVEIKNLNSFRHLARSLEHEIERQGRTVADGAAVAAETRGFDPAHGVTFPVRSKERTADYRYFPEPDLPPLCVDARRRDAIAAELPELPWRRRDRLAREHGLPPDEASVLTASRELADYFERAVAARRRSGGTAADDAKAVADWVRTEVLRELGERGIELDGRAGAHSPLREALPPEDLAELSGLVADGTVSHSAAKDLLSAVWGTGEAPSAAVDRLGLAQIQDDARLAEWVDAVVAAHPDEVERYAAGKSALLGFFVGRVMRRSGGRADPRRVRALLRSALDAAHRTDPVAPS
ncbi:MAG: Asp-tRNA(Asn)/Glu-tRNA(Gln) amidotransferase subunit GatB [Acidobacteriota bacterium]|jgi:aspartyl-tRNA(Asn)/glutamyl-tRNA(Gln) amidotransferase subunit B